MPPTTPWGGGRFTTLDASLAKLPRDISSRCLEGIAVELDLVRAWPHILHYRCEELHIPHPAITTYGVEGPSHLVTLLQSSTEAIRQAWPLERWTQTMHVLPMRLLMPGTPAIATGFVKQYLLEVQQLCNRLHFLGFNPGGWRPQQLLSHVLRSVAGVFFS